MYVRVRDTPGKKVGSRIILHEMLQIFFRTKNTIFYGNYLSQIGSTAELVESYFLPCIWRMIRGYVQGRTQVERKQWVVRLHEKRH